MERISPSNKVVQSLWYGRPMGLVEQLSIQSFLSHGYAFHLYVYEPIQGVPSGATICDANVVMPKAKCDELLAQSKTIPSNLFRYLLLYQNGGWWVDCDVVCLRELPEDQEYIAGSVGRSGVGSTPTPAVPFLLNTAVMLAPKRANILSNAISAFSASLWPKRWDSYPVLRNKFMRLQAWLRGKRNFPPFFHAETGPKLLTDLFKYHRLTNYTLSPQAFYPVHWNDWQSIFNGETDMAALDNSYCLHLWNNMFHENPNIVENPAQQSVFCSLVRQYLT